LETTAVAVVLRLARHGQKKRPHYRIVAAEKTFRRDGRFLEILGTYNPMVEPPALKIKEDRIKHWIEAGALPSQNIRSLIVKNIPGYIEAKEEGRLKKVQAKRKARKARAKTKTS